MSNMHKRKSECIRNNFHLIFSNPDELFDIAQELKTATEERKEAGMMIEQMAQHENVIILFIMSNNN